MTAEEALAHPYFANLRDEEFETTANLKINFDFEHEDVSLQQLQSLIYEEMLKMHPEYVSAVENGALWHIPVQPDSELYTLDLDGSLIYLGNIIFFIFAIRFNRDSV